MSDDQRQGAEEPETKTQKFFREWKEEIKTREWWVEKIIHLCMFVLGILFSMGIQERHAVERCNVFIAETYINNPEYQQCLHLVTGDKYPSINMNGTYMNFSHVTPVAVPPLGVS